MKDYSRREIAQKIAGHRAGKRNEISRLGFGICAGGQFRARRRVRLGNGERFADRAKDALEMCDLKNYEARLMNQLSGGERQRVVLARALATEAENLLLDEPTANLDLAHQALMFRLVRDRCEKRTGVGSCHHARFESGFGIRRRDFVLKNGANRRQKASRKGFERRNSARGFRVEVLLDENPAERKKESYDDLLENYEFQITNYEWLKKFGV